MMIHVYTTLLSMKLLNLSGNINMVHRLPVPMGPIAISHTSERIATLMLVLPVLVHPRAIFQKAKARLGATCVIAVAIWNRDNQSNGRLAKVKHTVTLAVEHLSSVVTV
jgi:uncharacterized membrane protein YphA (DoxX/SURF4 family)